MHGLIWFSASSMLYGFN